MESIERTGRALKEENEQIQKVNSSASIVQRLALACGKLTTTKDKCQGGKFEYWGILGECHCDPARRAGEAILLFNGDCPAVQNAIQPHFVSRRNDTHLQKTPLQKLRHTFYRASFAFAFPSPYISQKF